jgi:hypothetical protein
VTLRRNGTPVAQRDKRGRRAAQVLASLRQHSNGAQYAEIFAALGNPGIKALDRLVASGEVLRPDRGRYGSELAATAQVIKSEEIGVCLILSTAARSFERQRRVGFGWHIPGTAGG